MVEPPEHLPAPRPDSRTLPSDFEPLLPDTQHVLAVLGGAVRKGAWEPAECVRTLAVMGGVRLDFRDADLLEGVTEVQALALMGSVEIIVPDDVNLDLGGLGIMGSFAHQGHHAEDPDAPTLRVRGLALWGSVGAKVKRA